MRNAFEIRSPQSQLAAELRARIAAGEIAGAMPGLRRIMADFGVTRTVAQGALAELMQTGQLISRGPNRAALPVARGDGPAGGTLLVYDRPVELRGGEHRRFFLVLEDSLPRPVTRLSLDSHDTPERETLRRILESPCRRIVLMDHRGSLADRLVEAGRIVLGTNLATESARASQVSVSHERLVRGAMRKAFEAGHRRVSFALWRRKPEVAAAMRAWIADEYARAGHRHSPEFDAPIVPKRTPESLHDCVRELLRHTPPTALIVSDFAQWMGTFMVLAAARLRVPDDVSLISLCAASEWDTASPTQAHFRIPFAAMLRTIRMALESAESGAPPKHLRLNPEWVPGDSLAPPGGAIHDSPESPGRATSGTVRQIRAIAQGRAHDKTSP